MAASEPLIEAVGAVAAALDSLAAPSMIIGGIAVIAAGVPRQTIDVDATILGREATLDEVVSALARHGISPRISNALEFARERQVLLLIHDATGVNIEVSFAWLPFEEEALARATTIDVSGQTVRIAIPEDLIVYKAAAWRDRDRSDIERLLSIHFAAIDLQRVRALIVEIAAALDDPARVDAFDQIVARARQA
jgi:predicted nucleotidyltransferase